MAASGGRSPDSEIRLVVELAADGSLLVASGEATSPAGVVLTAGVADVASIVDGRLRLDVGYMQGRTKLAGDHRLVLGLLAATAGEGAEAFRAAVAEATDLGLSSA